MVEVIERIEGRYDTYEVEFGTVYRWCPGCVVVECDCGERSFLTASMTTCSECGADRAAVVQDELNQPPAKGEDGTPLALRYETRRRQRRVVGVFWC